jgi:nucleoside-diphosphate-sugar epimerase
MAKHSPDRPGYWIHCSGTGILTFEDVRQNSYGDLREREYNDWDGVNELTSLPDDALHRNVDKIVLDCGLKASDRVKTAIVGPPTIYGPGRGPGNTRSIQIYLLAKCVLQRKKGVQIGKGQNIWHEIHINDLSDLWVRLGEEAANGSGKATWGKEGYYLAENGMFAWGDIQKAVAKAAFEKGYIPSAEMDVLDEKRSKEVLALAPYLWGTNSRGRAVRARKLFGWSPHRPTAMDLVPAIVDLEAKRWD